MLVACCTLSCSPQKRLAYLLATHPELQQEKALPINHPLVLPADSASLDFTIADLSGIANETSSPEQSRPQDNDLTVSTKTGAIATISALGKPDAYRLQVSTKSDTIILRDTITVPAYTTRIEYKDKIIHKMNNGQAFFFWVGIIAMVLIVLTIVIKIVLKFIN